MEGIDALKLKAGSGKLADHPCVRRLRNRRLVLYLYLQGFQPAYDWIINKTDLYMSGRRLQELVARGQWSHALSYIYRFVPPAIGGVESSSLCFFLNALGALANVAACSTTGALVLPGVYNHAVGFLTTIWTVKLRSMFQNMLYSTQFRASLDWELVWEKASVIAHDLALAVPQLRRKLFLPAGPRRPHDLLPIGPHRPRRHRRERSRWPTSSAIAKCYLNKKRSLTSSSLVLGLNSEAGRNRLVDLIEGCLKASTPSELHQGH